MTYVWHLLLVLLAMTGASAMLSLLSPVKMQARAAPALQRSNGSEATGADAAVQPGASWPHTLLSYQGSTGRAQGNRQPCQPVPERGCRG
jgi:hypothetical protein